MKSILTFCLFTVSCLPTRAQITETENLLRNERKDTLMGWNTGGIAALSLSQSSFTHWAAGGQNALAANGLVSVFANLKRIEWTWDNSLDLGYGIQMQGKTGDVIKTDDKVEALSKYGRKAFGDWYYSAMLDFRTQMTPGYNYPNDTEKISDFMAPAYLLGAVGLDFKPTNTFSLFIAPVTAKVTFVNDARLANAGAYGVEPAVLDSSGHVVRPGKRTRLEFGGYLRSQWQYELMKDVVLNTKLDLFSNYLEKPGNIDVNWDVLLAMKVNRSISATINTQLIYDDDVDIAIDNNGDGVAEKFGPRVQFKEVIGVGVSYKF